VYAVDVSASLIDQAKRLNSDVPNCKFEPLAGEDLSMVSDRSIDLAYSILVLQHQSRRTTIRAYLQEFMRVLRPDGLAVFQLPTHIPLRNRIQPRRRAYCALRGLGVPPGVLYARLGLDPLRVLDLPQREVFETIAGAGGRVVTVREDDLAGAFPSATYYVTRPSH
jgi:SAM-dependent methyltransferase